MAGAPMLFALDASRAFGERVAEVLGIPVSGHEERAFEDGEHKSRPLVSVREQDVYVLQSLHGRGAQSVNDKLLRLLFFVGALKDSGAARVTAVTPYLAYARKDRRTQPNDPVTTRYVATLFEAVGTDRVMAVDVHNPSAFENAFRCPTEHLEARHALAAPLAGAVGDEPTLVFSPDAGGVKRAERFRLSLEQCLERPISNGFMEKTRSGGVISGQHLVGDIGGKTVIVVDDLIAAGDTLVRAAEACRARGAHRVMAAVTHGVFAPGAEVKLRKTALERIFLGDTIPLEPTLAELPVTPVALAPFVAEAIRRLHWGEPPADLAQA